MGGDGNVASTSLVALSFSSPSEVFGLEIHNPWTGLDTL